MEKIKNLDFWPLEPKCLIFSSKFSVLFPQYQENYLRESWKIILRIIRPYGMKARIDLSLGKMEVKTTKETRDPFIIFKARDFLKLLARSVPVQQACKIFEKDIFCDIVKISSFRLNKERFLRRRKRIIGHRGLTVRSIEIVTGCYLLVQGNTVCCMGGHDGLKMARKIIQECMLNIHPISQLKILWFKKCLSKDPKLKSKSWENFFPSLRKNKSKIEPDSIPGMKKEKKTIELKSQFYEGRKGDSIINENLINIKNENFISSIKF
mmetsp:Transcript_3063/g.7175  ORF Transcript_3063/g.7175 Transcript_3063/m.7175 type:complete len:266 (-) Transcript_3063:369-1166(-)